MFKALNCSKAFASGSYYILFISMVTKILEELEWEKNRKTAGSGNTLKTTPDCHFLSQPSLVIISPLAETTF